MGNVAMLGGAVPQQETLSMRLARVAESQAQTIGRIQACMIRAGIGDQGGASTKEPAPQSMASYVAMLEGQDAAFRSIADQLERIA